MVSGRVLRPKPPANGASELLIMGQTGQRSWETSKGSGIAMLRCSEGNNREQGLWNALGFEIQYSIGGIVGASWRFNIILAPKYNVNVNSYGEVRSMEIGLVLCVGKDPLLLFIRCAILKTAGYSVVSVATETELAETFVANDFDLVILCHTLPKDTKVRSAIIVRNYSPTTPILALAALEGQRYGYADATVATEPSLMLAAIPELLAKAKDRGGRRDFAAAG